MNNRSFRLAKYKHNRRGIQQIATQSEGIRRLIASKTAQITRAAEASLGAGNVEMNMGGGSIGRERTNKGRYAKKYGRVRGGVVRTEANSAAKEADDAGLARAMRQAATQG